MAEPPPQSVPRPNIAEKNNRLFALFQRKLAVDTPESYIVQAEKFTQWLKNEKAYYLEARHQIINILLTAQFTLRRSAGLGDDHSNIRFHVSACRDHPLTETYTQLVLAIQPYQSRFVEPHFQDAVRGLLATVLPSPDPSLVPPGPRWSSFVACNGLHLQTLSFKFNPTIRPFSVVIDRSQQMRPSSSSLASALEPQPISNTGTNIPPPSSPRAIATPQVAAIGASQPTSSTSPTVNLARSQGNESAAVPVVSLPKPLPRRIKKKKVDLSKLIEADVAEYTQKMGVIQKPVEVAHVIPKLEHNPPQLPVTLPDFAPQVSSTTSSTGALSADRPADAVMDVDHPSEVSTALRSSDVEMVDAQPSHLPCDADAKPSESESSQMTDQLSANIDRVLNRLGGPGLEVEMTELAPSNLPDSAPTPVDAPMEVDTPAPVIASRQNSQPKVSVNNVVQSRAASGSSTPTPLVAKAGSQAAHLMSFNLPFHKISIAPKVRQTLTDFRISHSRLVIPTADNIARLESLLEAAGALVETKKAVEKTDYNIHAAKQQLGIEEGEVPMQDVVPTPISISHLEVATQVPSLPERPLDGNPPAQETLRAFTVGLDTQPLQPSTEMYIPPPPPENPIESTLPTPPTSRDIPSGFGYEAPRPEEVVIPSTNTGIVATSIMAHHFGSPSGTIHFSFSINQEQLDSITKWNDRSKHSYDVHGSLCLSLLCFSTDDIRACLNTSGAKEFNPKQFYALLPNLMCSWPKTGGLSMDALWNGQRRKFPMAPPFALPSNALVDVSPFSVLGPNTFSLKQTRDMSKYLFLVCAHHPTPFMLSSVAQRRQKETEWTGWLDKMSQPPEFSFRIPIEV